MRGSGITEDLVLKTDNEDLGAGDLPFGEGSAKLTLPGSNPILGAALTDPDHIFKFGENVAKQISPAGFSQYDQGLKQLKATAGLDLHKDLLAQIKQLSISAPFPNRLEFRAELADGQQFADSLSKAKQFIQGALNEVGNGNLTLVLDGSGPDATYIVKQDAREVASFAVRENALVGSIGPAGGLPSPTSASPFGAAGSLGILVDLRKLTGLPQVAGNIKDPLARQVLSSLGTVSERWSETPDQITEQSVLEVGAK